MAIGVHTNYAQIVAANTLNSTNADFTKNMERLATGKRINSAADDAAGMQIATRLNTEVRSIGVVQRNGGDAISMLQTAEGALNEVLDIGQRMKELALQADNGSNSTADVTAIDAEYTALTAEITDILGSTKFNGSVLLGAGGKFASAVNFQLDTSGSTPLAVDVSTESAAIDTAVTGLGATAVGAAGNLDTLIDAVTSTKSAFGATINRVEHKLSNFSNVSQNLQAAAGRITDVDFATEGAAMSKNQMLMQSGAQMLSQTKMVPQLAMQLLG